ncbi:hypothetical protein ACQ86N_24860 [Puia sp. P3]|uniref:hypothetical protein n=1 Tax=Puia sp. P3 TaxID=3423952 RepID=UPI003D678A2F
MLPAVKNTSTWCRRQRPPSRAHLHNSGAALNFFYSLYDYIPRLDNVGATPELETTDEVCIPNWNNHTAKGYDRGQLNSSSPYWNYWGTAGGNPGAGMYDGIRQCYTFLDNIDKTPDIAPADLQRMKGEASFPDQLFPFCAAPRIRPRRHHPRRCQPRRHRQRLLPLPPAL